MTGSYQWEAEQEQRAEILRALTAYCENHSASRRNWRNDVGLSCDELGCMICNGGSAAETAAWWLAAYEAGPSYDEDGYPDGNYVDLPFDPGDEEFQDLLLDADEAGLP